jgi:hypothetical protein
MVRADEKDSKGYEKWQDRPAERKGFEMHSNTMASCNKSQTNCKLFNNTFMGFVRVLLILIYLAIMNGGSSWLF